MGKRIRDDQGVNKWSSSSKDVLAGLQEAIGLSESTLYRAIQTYDKYPKINELPES